MSKSGGIKSKAIQSKLSSLSKSWVGWTVLIALAYVIGNGLASLVIYLFAQAGVFDGVDATLASMFVRIVIYGAIVAAILGVINWFKLNLSPKELGIDRWLTWRDIGLGVAGVIIYAIVAMMVLSLVQLIPGVDWGQTQELGVERAYGSGLWLIFVVLVVITPVVEEFIFRGVLYGGLRKRKLSIWASALVVSLLFGMAHGQINVGVDVFILSMVACYAREVSGSIWPGVILHMVKNLLAFTVVFVVNGNV